MSKIVPGTLIRVWSGLIKAPLGTHRPFEHLFGIVISTFRDESEYINRGTRNTGHYTSIIFVTGEYQQVFLEDDDERYLWTVIA